MILISWFLKMRRINRYLNTQLIDICQRTMLLEELNSKLSHYLPATLQPQCHVGSFIRGCLVIVVTDPVWASQLRYSLPDLRDKLRAEAGIYQLTSIKISITSLDAIPTKKTSTRLPLSKKSRELINIGGDQCSYPPLKKALYQLAKDNDDSKP